MHILHLISFALSRKMLEISILNRLHNFTIHKLTTIPRSMIPRFVGIPRSTSNVTTPTFTSAIAEECKKISMAYMNEKEPSDNDNTDSLKQQEELIGEGHKRMILDLGDEETNALIDKIMQGTEESGDIIDLDFLLSGVPDTQSEPSATPARYSFAFLLRCSSLLVYFDYFGFSFISMK